MPGQGQDAQDRDHHARLAAEHVVDVLQVLLHRLRTHTEHEPDLLMSLALGHPAENLSFSRSEAQEPAKRLSSRHQGIRSPLLPAPRFLRIASISLGQRLGYPLILGLRHTRERVEYEVLLDLGEQAI